MLELWWMWSTRSFPSLPGPFWLGVVEPDKVLSISQIELNCVLMLNWIVWNRTVFGIETAYLCKTEMLEIELFWHLTELFWHLTVYWYAIKQNNRPSNLVAQRLVISIVSTPALYHIFISFLNDYYFNECYLTIWRLPLRIEYQYISSIPQTFVSILIDIGNAGIWMGSIFLKKISCT